MRSKKEIEKDVQSIKKGIDELKEKNSHLSSIVSEKAKSDDINSSLFSLVKYLIDENKRTTMILQSLAQGINRLESELFSDEAPSSVAPEQEAQLPIQQGAKEMPISDLDAKILQIIQRKGMACADDIKANLNYKGRNAASARLSKLYKEGLLTRYQLGHKVFYKFDAGKATNILIISPPQ
ncbi:MAG: winged helix-turn-helix domain-containing protein [Candidatus Micrarchaeia archaeon]